MTVSCDFTANFSIDFAVWKSAVQVTNGNHVTSGHGESHKFMLVIRYPNRDYVTKETLTVIISRIGHEIIFSGTS